MKNWTTKQLEEICEIQIGGTPSRNNSAFWDNEKITENFWVSIRDLRQKSIINTNERLSNLGVKNSNAKLVFKDTVLLSFKLTIGKVAFAGKDLYTNEAIAALIATNIDNNFLYFGLQHWDLLQDVDQAIKGATLNKEKLKKLRITVPKDIKEQIVIAEVLGKIDSAIEQTQKLIEKQKRIKQGLMQDLLTKGIDEHGNIRNEETHHFKDSPLGRIPEEWNALPVFEIGNVKVGRQRSPKYQTGKFTTPYLRVANVFDGFFDFSDVLEMDFTPSEKVTFSVLKGDVFLNEGQSLELVGRSAIYEGENNKYCFQNSLIRFRSFQTNNPYFCKQVFKYFLDTGKFMDVAKQTTSVAHLGTNRFAEMFFPRPELAEQNKIVSILKSHDNATNNLQIHLSKLEAMKKGLMQDLLTGKKSVNDLISERINTSQTF